MIEMIFLFLLFLIAAMLAVPTVLALGGTCRGIFWVSDFR